MKRFIVVAAVALAVACRGEAPMSSSSSPSPSPSAAAPSPAVDPAKHQQEISQWQEQRAERLKKEDSWLTLVGLFWLEEGQNVVTLPSKQTLRLTRAGEKVTLLPDASMTVEQKPLSGPTELRNDADPAGPAIVQMGSVRFNVIKRGERIGLRVKDANAPTRTQFAGLDYFPIDAKWRVDAQLEPYSPMKKIPIDDVTGMRSESDSPGALVFTLEGKEYRLDPVLEEGTDELFLIFRDETAKDETYPAGRYLYAPKPGPDGRTVIDFNKAYNPPCAFTPYATCPLPPLQNRLKTRIEAGEKRYAGGHA
ncbi:MAG TPA: DUF1684 domain-containing protein [Thermoanaerobaculia bacterium]|jgi:hypothetical protein